MELSLFLKISLSLSCLIVCGLFIHVYNVLWLKPERLRSKLRRQGIRGPPPSFFYGNIPEMRRLQSMATKPAQQEHIKHDWAATLFPYFEQWQIKYGPIFMYSAGSIQRLYVSHPDVVKEISLCTSLDLGKPLFLQKEHGPLIGQGILASNGSIWAHQRRIIAPELYLDKVKGMVNLMVESAESLLKSWECKIESEGGIADIRVDEDLKKLSSDIISRACFRSSYSEGKEIFARIRALKELISAKNLLIGIPGLRYIPTKNNRELWRLEKEINSLILKVVKERKEAAHEKDILQMILEGANKTDNQDLGLDSTDRFIVDNCKNIYFAGQETTAMSASWTLMLLSSHPEWQARVHAELVAILDGRVPDAEMLRRMKVLTMVIQEALRLYPPSSFVARETFHEMKFGDIHVPAGVNLWIPLMRLHQDPDIWGPEAHKFNPERFASGSFNACKFPHTYMPFGIGARKCVGQNFAMTELKIVLSLLLSKFSFSLSPKYSHSPAFRMVIEPKHGLNLLVRRCQLTQDIKHMK